MKLSEKLKVNSQKIRVREFVIAGQKLRVRVPLVSEMDEMNDRVKNADISIQYEKLSAPLIEKKESIEGEAIEFKEDDILISGKSVKEMAKMAAQTNARILEMFKLLVPEMDGENMENLTYEEIENEFPFSIQIELSKKITEVISPGYEEARKN